MMGIKSISIKGSKHPFTLYVIGYFYATTGQIFIGIIKKIKYKIKAKTKRMLPYYLI